MRALIAFITAHVSPLTVPLYNQKPDQKLSILSVSFMLQDFQIFFILALSDEDSDLSGAQPHY